MVVVSLVELYGQRRTKKDKYFQQRGTKSRLLSRLLPAFAFSLSFETRVHLLFDYGPIQHQITAMDHSFGTGNSIISQNVRPILPDMLEDSVWAIVAQLETEIR